MDDLLIIDLPGVQNFGVSKLTPVLVAQSFPEIRSLMSNCEYSDCRHIAEPNCAVKESLETGGFAQSRYDSYLDMLGEIESARKY